MVPFAQDSEQRASLGEETQRILRGVRSWPDVPRQVSELVALGEGSMQHAFELLTAGSEPGTPGAQLALDAKRRTALMLLFQGLPSSKARKFLGSISRRPYLDAERLEALRLSARIAGRTDFASLALLASEGALAPLSREVVQAYDGALRACLAHDPRGLRSATRSFRRLPDALVGPFVRAIAETQELGRLESTRALLELLGRKSKADALVLLELTRMGQPAIRLEDLQLEHLRTYLSTPSANLKALTCDALRILGDAQSIPGFIELLDQKEPVRSASHRALVALARRQMPAKQTTWRTWYEAELDWWRSHAQTSRAAISVGSPAAAAAALQEVARHRIDDAATAELLLQGLLRMEPELIVLTCEILASVPAFVTRSMLIDLLEHKHPKARSAAHQALQANTGRNLPMEPKYWRALSPSPGRN